MVGRSLPRRAADMAKGVKLMGKEKHIQTPFEEIQAIIDRRPKDDMRPWSDEEIGAIDRIIAESRYGERDDWFQDDAWKESRRLAEGYTNDSGVGKMNA